MEFDINIVLNIALSMFFVMMVGYYLRKKDIIDARFSKNLSKLVLHVTQPILIVASMIKMKSSLENTKFLVKIFLISLMVHILAAIVGWLSMRIMKDNDVRKLSEHSIIFLNIMFFGLPIVEKLYGSEAVAWACFFSINFHVFAWTYGLVILGRGRDDIKLSPKKMLLNYGTVPCTIGILLYLVNFSTHITNLKLDGVITALNYIGGLCTPISLLVLGGVLATQPIKKLFGDWRIYYVCFVKLILFPIGIFVLAKYVVGLNAELSMFTLIMAGLPTASITNMFAELYDIRPGYAATSVGMTTAIAVVTLPLVVYVAQFI